MSGVDQALLTRRKRLKEFLEAEELTLRAELQRNKEAEKLCYLDNLREKVNVIRRNKEMQREFVNDQRRESSRGSSYVENPNNAKERYGEELREQMRLKEESLAKIKKEDERYHKMLEALDIQSVEKEKQDVLRRRNTQLQYTNELKNQLADISERKKEVMKQDQVASNVYNYGYINIGEDHKSPKALMKKQQNRDDYKRGLDEQLEMKLKLKDNENNEVNGSQPTFPFGNFGNETDGLSRKLNLRKDQEGYMNYVRNQIEESKREDMALEHACSENYQNGDERRQNERDALKTAQQKLQDDTVTSWDQQTVERKHDREVKDEADQKENKANQKIFSDFQLEEDQKKKDLQDRNKQYQLDLLAQIKEKKERKDYY